MNLDPKAIGKRAFPDYRGRKFRLDQSGRIFFCDLNWSGGSKNTYRAIRLQTGETRQGHDYAPWANPIEGKSAEIPAGFAIVEWTRSCGKDLGLTVYTAKVPELVPSFVAETNRETVAGSSFDSPHSFRVF